MNNEQLFIVCISQCLYNIIHWLLVRYFLNSRQIYYCAFISSMSLKKIQKNESNRLIRIKISFFRHNFKYVYLNYCAKILIALFCFWFFILLSLVFFIVWFSTLCMILKLIFFWSSWYQRFENGIS